MAEETKAGDISRVEEGMYQNEDLAKHDLENADHVVDENDLGEIEVMRIRQSNVILRKLRAFETWMDQKLKVEGMGVERIPEEKRRPPNVASVSVLLNIVVIAG
jgi:hypothetical protein